MHVLVLECCKCIETARRLSESTMLRRTKTTKRIVTRPYSTATVALLCSVFKAIKVNCLTHFLQDRRSGTQRVLL